MKLIILLFFSILFYSIIGYGQATTYLDSVKTLVGPSEDDIAEAKRVASILQFEKKNPVSSQTKSNLTVYAQAILDLQVARLPTQELRDKVLDIYKNKIRYGLGKLGVSGWSPEAGIVVIDLPQSLHNTVIDFHIVFHEMEHVVQHVLSEHNGAKENKSTLADFKKKPTLEEATIRMYSERGAMAWEWLFLNGLPAKFLYNSLYADPSVRIGGYAEQYKQTVLNGALSKKEYLKIQWKRGRYSAESYKDIFECAAKKRLRKYYAVGGACAALGALSAVFFF